ncbi:hypothetical protein BKA64DRAFT_660961 [Cadophora sp. MPI-SDFR-AT-0126]|nr:hypothetical protein BKA64DRAFT_660961 [Leotiomycetes sp. MPI-SDFR-AT-0126]
MEGLLQIFSSLASLLIIPALREITIVLPKRYGEVAIERKHWHISITLKPIEGKEELVDDLVKALEARKVQSMWKHGVPKVLIKSWSRLRA